ncbi:hypothetical protein F2Q68_00020361 [Brassica cretica]|uniref:Uncharacterized protein n=1 Tax=Brassica cretica TaxID=69181 RepID=A0A8S9G0J4_BRACR|nr:hypothetical protein F2Q68_00020361 [Brassica cretica]
MGAAAEARTGAGNEESRQWLLDPESGWTNPESGWTNPESGSPHHYDLVVRHDEVETGCDHQ